MSEFLRLRQSRLEWRCLDGEVIALDTERGVYVGTNQSGRVLWEALVPGATRDQLVHALVDEYQLEHATAERDVDEFLQYVRDQQLLEAQEGQRHD